MNELQIGFFNLKATRTTTLWALCYLLLSPSQVAAQQDSPRLVSGAQITSLIRNTIIAVNNANLTGNYTVLRDLGSISFRHGRSAANLSDFFRPLREGRIDLADTVPHDPFMSAPPKLSTSGILQLKGWFSRETDKVTFDLTYRFEVGTWRIMSISLGLQPVSAKNVSGNQKGQKKKKPAS